MTGRMDVLAAASAFAMLADAARTITATGIMALLITGRMAAPSRSVIAIAMATHRSNGAGFSYYGRYKIERTASRQ